MFSGIGTLPRQSVRVLILGCVVAGLLVLGVGYVYRLRSEYVFSRGLAAAVLSGDTTVNLRNIPSPSWQRVYIFGPYTHPSTISPALGFIWTGSDVDTIESSDGVNLLLFVRDRRVVMSVLHPRAEGDFVPDDVGHDFSRDEAEFAIVRRPSDNWSVLMPQQEGRRIRKNATAPNSWP